MGLTIAELAHISKEELEEMSPEKRAFFEEETDIPNDAPVMSKALLDRMQAEADTEAALLLDPSLPFNEIAGLSPDQVMAWTERTRRELAEKEGES